MLDCQLLYPVLPNEKMGTRSYMVTGWGRSSGGGGEEHVCEICRCMDSPEQVEGALFVGMVRGMLQYR